MGDTLIRIGIIGYGNLGKALEKELKKDNSFHLETIFSRRSLGNDIEKANNVFQYKNKIDILINACGSRNDLEWMSPILGMHFNVIDSFDTHQKASNHFNIMDKIGKNTGHLNLVSAGWDPGLLSIFRIINKSILRHNSKTCWGPGISEGHSAAIRNIKGVIDAIEITIPDKESLEQVMLGMDKKINHQRVCYVAANKDFESRIKEEIQSMENYFKGYDTTVIFEDLERIKEKKEKLFHKGLVISKDSHNEIIEKVTMEDNSFFTAKVILASAKALFKMSKNRIGAITMLDIPPSFYLDDNIFTFL